jgi:preprotein translocase subunit SecE
LSGGTVPERASWAAERILEVKAMSTQPQVQTVSTSADKAKLAAAGALMIGSLVAFYLLGQRDMWLRVVVLLVGLALATGVFFSSESGRQLIAYGRESVREVRKVVWPTRKEAVQMTGYVFAFVVVMALFLWVTDKTLEWVLYDLILGWKR